MIKELVQFVDSIDTEFKGIGIKPKEGLHILLKIRTDAERVFIDDQSLSNWCFTRKKDLTPDDISFLNRCATFTQLSWCVNTNKCFDLPTKAIHSCSPYCIALKRENLIGGEKYKSNTKVQVYDRIKSYFEKASALIDSGVEKQRIKLFAQALASAESFNHWLSFIPEYAFLKDSDYVIFYLDEPIEKYEASNLNYLADKLFNTNDYNKPIENELYGTSDFFNGYPTKKPFLTHKSAYFDIASRISAKDARSLYDFQELMGRGILPKPLPIFIHEDEIQEKNKRSLKDASIALLKTGAATGSKIGYQEIIESLYKDYKGQLGNYYLLFYANGLIKDFDFVPKFEYLLNNTPDVGWKIHDYFNIRFSTTLNNVFELQLTVLQIIFNNALITKTKSGDIQFKYFDDLELKYSKSPATFLLVQQFRKAFYDFIYKSKRQSITQETFNYILSVSIMEDLKLDEIKNNYHTEERNIKQKLNIWFSLSENFKLSKNKNLNTMASKLQEHRLFIKKLAKGESNIEQIDQYAFTVGQVIYYLLSKSKTADRSYKRLEPFLQQVHVKELNKAIYRLFDTYKHENFSGNFRNPFAEIMDYEDSTNLRDFMPTVLAGIFSKNELFSEKEQNEAAAEIIETTED